MLILSKFRDYYDPVLKQVGVDKTIVYERHTSIVHINVPFCSCNDFDYKYELDFNRGIGAVIFCGKAYPFLYTEEGNQMSYDLDEITEFITSKDFRNQKLDKFNASMKRDYVESHREAKSPVLLVNFDITQYNYPWHNDGLVCANPPLNLLQFYKIKHPVQTFQELMMYLSGVLGTPEKVGPPMTSKQKVQSHGFDKWSFRKDTPPTRKRK